jgi:FMN reductase
MQLVFDGGVQVAGIVGNLRAGSRTYRAVRTVAEAFAAALGGEVDGVLDLVELKTDLFDLGAPSVRAAVERLGQADLLVVGSPTYKASFSGLLKAFFDPLDSAQFVGKLAVPVMMGGSELHALAVETALRPLLVEVGATVATPGLYVVESRIEEIDTIAAEYTGRVLASFGQPG